MLGPTILKNRQMICGVIVLIIRVDMMIVKKKRTKRLV